MGGGYEAGCEPTAKLELSLEQLHVAQGFPLHSSIGSKRPVSQEQESQKRQEEEATRSAKGIDSLPSYSTGQKNHRVSSDSKGWKHRLDGWVAGPTVRMTAVVVAISVTYAPALSSHLACR